MEVKIMKKILIGAIFLALVVFAGTKVVQPVFSTEQCNNTTTYEKRFDFSDSKVNINFSPEVGGNYHDTITVSAGSGYAVMHVWLDVSNDDHNGYHLYATGPLNNYNPNPGTTINWAKVEVKKTCPNPSPTPVASPTPLPTPEPTPYHSVCRENSCVQVEGLGDNACKSDEDCVQPEETPAPVVVSCEGIGNDADGHPCGWSPPLWTPPEYKPSVCSVALPEAVTPAYVPVNDTSVKLVWTADDTNTTAWTLSWGYEKDSLPYGLPDGIKLTKEAREYTVGNLEPNTIRWFELTRWNGDNCAVAGARIDP